MTAEKRRHKRIPVKLEVYWERASGMQLVHLSDMSLSGCFIRTNKEPAVQSIVNLEIRLPSGKWLSLSGKVVRCIPGMGFGVEFTSELEGDLMRLLNPMQDLF